jgi:hypothetical protein
MCHTTCRVSLDWGFPFFFVFVFVPPIASANILILLLSSDPSDRYGLHKAGRAVSHKSMVAVKVLMP